MLKILVHCSCSVGKLFLLILLTAKYTKVLRKTIKAVTVLKITNETFFFNNDLLNLIPGFYKDIANV